MAVPVTAIAKTAAAILSNERMRKTVGWIVAAVLSPIILIIVVFCALCCGTADHNTAAVDLSFHDGAISSQMPVEYRSYIEDMRSSFVELDGVVSEIAPMIENGSLDADQMKAIFYALFFGSENLRMDGADYRNFADCFVRYEERTRTVTDADGNESEETYTVAIPITDLGTVYANLESTFGRTITPDDQANAQRVYILAVYGSAAGAGGGNGLPPGVEMGAGSFADLMAEATKYIGFPYVWGGSTPTTSFDCSGFVCWVYTKSGVCNLPRTTAWGIYNRCAIVPKVEAKPGDLIFFTRTYACNGPVSHVGIYVGGGQMLHCGSPIGYANIESNYWREHFYAIGRLPSGM